MNPIFASILTNSTKHKSKSTCSVQLLKTCRQIYVEAGLLPFSNNVIQIPHSAFLADWKIKPGQQSAIVTVRFGVRDGNGSILPIKRLYSCINICPSIKCVELLAGGKRAPNRLYKKLQKSYPGLDVKVMDVVSACKHVRKEL